MKAIIYIVAIVAIAAGGWFSYSSMGKFEKMQAARKQLDTENEARKATTKKTDAEADAMEGELNTAKKILAELEANRDNTQSQLQLAKKSAASWANKIAGQKEKMDKTQDLIVQVKQSLAAELGGNVELDQIPGLVQKLEDDLKLANKQLEELEVNVKVAEKRADAGEEQIEDMQQRIAKRASRLKGNSAEGRITAVNHDWGFVTISVPSNMPVNNVSKLIVKRGTGYIGNLKINAIEGNRIIADIDYKAMTPGMVVQPGDAVVLSKPVSN